MMDRYDPDIKYTDKIYSKDEIKSIVAPIAAKYGVDRVYLFGSYSRGEATEESDIDFVIDKGRVMGLEFCGMLIDLQDIFGKNVDLLTSDGINLSKFDPDFKYRIAKDLAVIYEK